MLTKKSENERERGRLKMGIMVKLNNFMALKIYILIGYPRSSAIFR
jgi:hypothetical protein